MRAFAFLAITSTITLTMTALATMLAEAQSTPIRAAGAPAAIGPYSQAVSIGPFVFLSGQLGLDPATGQLVTGGVESETRRAMENLRQVLKAADLSFVDVVKTTIYVTDMAQFSSVNTIYGQSFQTGTPPAR
jgi:2-iminobutanoate/2-iminopropanoate deaminase